MSRRDIAVIRRRLEGLELQHLRAHAAELAEKLECTQQELSSKTEEFERAEDWAIHWRDEALQLSEELMEAGKTVCLSKDGSLHVAAAPAGAA